MAKNPKIRWEERQAYAGNLGYGAPRARLRLFGSKEPRKLKSPSVLGTQFMGDLWHEAVDPGDIAVVFSVIHDTPRHIYLMLTKRPRRMADWVQEYYGPGGHSTEPFPNNVYLGVTVENQQAADERIPELLKIPAAGRWVSIEPMLGPVDINEYLGWDNPIPSSHRYPTLSGVVVGGESGPKARPMHPDWVRDIRDQCKAAGVPFYMKQMGREWARQTPWAEGGISIARLGDSAGTNMNYWPDGLRVRETAWEMPE